jgi:hypothetical protein
MGTDGCCSLSGCLMSAVTHVCTIDYVAKMLDEDVELLEAIVYNNDNLTYGSIISDDGIEELTDLIKAARLTTKTWYEFLDDFVDDTYLVLRIKAKSPR